MVSREFGWGDDFDNPAEVAHFYFEVRGTAGAVTRRLLVPNEKRVDLRAIGGFDPSGIDDPKVVPRIDRKIRRRLAKTLGLRGHFSLFAQRIKAPHPVVPRVLHGVADEKIQ